MKKFVATVLTIATLFVTGGWSDTPIPNNENDNSLINYIEENDIESYEEFVEIIRVLSPESIDISDEEISSISSFNINIDYDNMVVSVITVSDISYGRAQSAGRGVSKSYYASNGLKIFTISVEGVFSYSSGSCTTTSASGSYTRATLSTWTSTPTVSSGNINAKKAYARITGTATSGSSSVLYALTLTCDDSGNFNSY